MAENSNKIEEIKEQLSDTKGVMLQNIDHILDRGDKIELLIDKTEDMNDQSKQFSRKSRTLRRKMWLKNMKTKLLITLIILFLIYILLSMACGFDFSKCS